MRLTKCMKNVLDAIKSQTIKQKGKNAGDVKARINAYEIYYQRTVDALERRGLIEWKWNTIHGSGLAATAKSLNY